LQTDAVQDGLSISLKVDGEYLVSGNFDGQIRYLGPNVTIGNNPHFYSSESAARQAISAWQEAREENPDRYPAPGNENDIYPAADIWSLYERDGQFLVSGIKNDSVVHLHPNATVDDRPYIYESRAKAEEAILEWLSENRGTDSEIRPANREALVYGLENESLSGKGWKSVRTYNSSLRTTSTDHVVQGRLYDSKGVPVKNATVVLHSNPRRTSTNQHGEYIFTNVSEGNHTLYAFPKNTSRNVAPQDIKLEIKSSGGASVFRSDPNAVYFERDGEAVLNRISLQMVDSQKIVVNGQGQNLTGNITVKQATNTGEYNLELTGAYNSTIGKEFISGKSSTKDLRVEGNEETETTFVAVSANETYALQDIDGAYQSGEPNPSITLIGNRHPENATITLYGQYNTTDVILTGNTNKVRTIEVNGSINPIGGSRNNEPQLTIYGSNRTEPFSSTRSKASNTEYTKKVPGNSEPINTKIELTGNTLVGTAQSRYIRSAGDVQVGGNIAPSNTVVTFYPETELSNHSVTGTGTEIVDISGNMDPESTNTDDGVKVTLFGRETSTDRAFTGTGTGSVTNNGNIDSRANISVTGAETENQRSVTGTGTGQITNNGNIDTEATVTIQGATTDLGTQTASGTLSDGNSVSINVDGNVPAENVQLELTGKTKETHIRDDEGQCKRKRLRDSADYTNCYDDNEWISLEKHNTYKIDWYVKSQAGMEHNGDEPLSAKSVLRVDGHGTIAYSRTKCEEWSHCSIHDDDDNEKEDFQSGVTTVHIGDTDYPDVVMRASTNIGDYGMAGAKADAEVWRLDGPGKTTVSVDGNSISTKDIGPGGKATVDLGTLEPGTHTIKIDSQSGVGANYTASWDEKQATSDLSVDANGDGNNYLTRSSPLREGQTVQTTTTISPGESTVSVNNNGPTPTWDASFAEITATNDIQADLNNDGATDIDRSAPLRAGQSVKRTVTIEPGSNTVSINYGGPKPSWTGTISETTATENTTVETNGGSASADTILKENEDADVRLSTLEPGNNTVNLTTVDGPKPKWTIYYTANSTTKDPTVDVDQDGKAEATYSGAITSPTTVEFDGLSPGSNAVEASSRSGPNPEIEIRFRNRTATKNPKVSVGNETFQHIGLLRQGETATFELSELDQGDTKISASTDAGEVDYLLSGNAVFLLEDPGVDYDADELNDAGYQGTLDEDQSVTVEAPGLRHGEQRLEFNAEVNEIEYELAYTERNVTKTPGFDIGGATACKQPGITGKAQECDVPTSNLTLGANELDLSTINGTVSYEVEYTAVTAPTTTTVSLNGTKHEYPSEFSGTGPLPDEATASETKNISSLQPGTYPVSIQTEKVDGLDTAADVTVTFSNNSYQSVKPTVVVISPNGTIHTKTVPESALSSSGELTGTYRMGLGEAWFDEGENQIIVRTPASTTINATLRGEGLVNQTRQFAG